MALQNFNRYKQAVDIINQVGVEVGLPAVTDPFTSSDPQYKRLINLLNICGNELIDLYPWSRIINEFKLTVVPGQVEYDLPLDWNCMIDQTMWRKGGLYPGFPASDQTWQYLANSQTGLVISVLFQENQGKLFIYPGVADGTQINMRYQSRGWAYSGTPPAEVYRDNVTAGTNVIVLDPTLISRYLKMKFLESVGFDTQKATDDFHLFLESRSSKDRSAPILNVARGGAVNFRYMDQNNVPLTGFGE
jgi:hypothetical protein